MTPVHRPIDSRSLAQGGPVARKAFTLLEMLIVIGIITLLAAILIPVVSQVKTRAAVAQTQGEMMRIMGACQMYFHDFNAYPGPLAETMLVGAPNQIDSGISLDRNATQTPSDSNFSMKITSSENLVLGLTGLLSPADAYNQPPRYSPPPPKHDVMGLNYTHPANYHYLDFLADEIPTPSGSGADYYAYGAPAGIFQADWNPSNDPNKAPNTGRSVSDSTVPEFMDHIPNPMAILYLRARPGATLIASATGILNGDPTQATAYNLGELLPYGFTQVRTAANSPSGDPGDFPPPSGYTMPSGLSAIEQGFWIYLMNPGIVGEPRGKNAFVLISAGPDRLYGTKDDIIVTP